MIDNLEIIVYLAAFPFIVWGLLAAFGLIMRGLSTAACPYCWRRIPRDVWKHGTPCPECGANIAEGVDSHSLVESMGLCRVCGITKQCIELWDGQTYCHSCIVQRSPRLLQEANGGQLAEEIPPAAGAATRRILLQLSSVLGGLAAVFIAPLLMAGKWMEALEAYATAILFLSPFIILYTGAVASAFWWARPKTIAWRGKLIVQHNFGLIVAPLAQCTWHEGRQWHMTLWNFGFLLRGPALILVLPKDVVKGGDRMAVGFTNETREVWRSFLELAGVPRTTKLWWWERKRAA